MFRSFLSCLVFASLAIVAQAQVSPKEQAKVYVGLRGSVKAAANYQFRVYSASSAEADPLTTTAGSYTDQAGLTTAVVSPNAFVTLIPGQLYHVSVTSTSWASADFQFNLPPGYNLLLAPSAAARKVRQTYLANAPSGGNGTTTFDLEVQPQDGANRLRAGFSTVPSIGEVLWAIGLGTTQTGRYAGVLRWRQSGITADLLDPLSLVYADPVDGDVSVTRAGDGSISSISTWGVMLEVTKDESPAVGYTITARPPWEDSTVFRKYHIFNPESTWQNKIRVDMTSYDTDVTRETQWTLSKADDVTKIEQVDKASSGSTTDLRRVETLSRVVATTHTDSDSSPLTENLNAGEREEIISIFEAGATTPVMRTRRVYGKPYSGALSTREELLREIADPGQYFIVSTGTNTAKTTNETPPTDALKWVTRYAYYTTSSASGSYGKLQSVSHSDGSWEVYKYFGDATSDAADAARWGLVAAVYKPWQDSSGVTEANATATNCNATSFDYAVSRDSGVWCELPAGAETKIVGATTAKRTISYTFSSSAPLRTETIHDYTASGDYLTTTKTVYHVDAGAQYAGRVYSQVNPDGTKVSMAYYYPTSLDYWNEIQHTGTEAEPSGMTATQVPKWASISIDPVWMVPNRSFLHSFWRDSAGRLVRDLNVVFLGDYSATVGTGTTAIAGDSGRSYTSEGYLAGEGNNKGEGTTYNYVNGKIKDQTNAQDGTSVAYTYDGMMRVSTKTVAGVSAASPYVAQAAIATVYEYDAANHEKKTTTSAGGLSVIVEKHYNRAGLLDQMTENGLVTDIAYTDGGRKVTMTLPGVSGSRPTKIETRYMDGSPKATAGTGVVGQYVVRTLSSGVSGIPDGSLVTTTYTLPTSDTPLTSAPTSEPRWTQAVSDWLGRKVKEFKPATSGTFAKAYFYNSKGQLYLTTEPNYANNLITYNAFGQPELSGLDLNGNGALDLASSDRITKSQTFTIASPAQSLGSRKQTLWYAYNLDGNGTPAQTGETQEPGGLETVGGETASSAKFITDLFGNQTTQRLVKIATGAGSPLIKMVNDLPTSTTDEVMISRNGVVQSKQTAQGLTTTYNYDALRRVVEEIDPRYGSGHPLKTAYYTNVSAAAGTYAIYSSNNAANGQVAWRKDAAGNQTTYTYSADNGRLISETNALGKATYTAYNLRGQVVRQWGPATYPIEYEYNDYGEKTKMRTFRSTSTDYTTSTWGTGTYPSTTGDLTTWAYDAATGLLLTKTDAAGRAVDYTYNIRGQLATREWSRHLNPADPGTARVKTTYGYDALTAEQTSITYNDGTPTISYTYNRLGQMATVSQAVSGFSLSMTLENSLSGKVTKETWDSTYFSGRILTRVLDTTTTGAKGRLKEVELGVTGSLGSDQDLNYGYDTSGRFNSAGLTGGATYAYAYTANSNLIASVNDSASGYAQLFTYEPYRDHVATIEGKFGARILAGVAYAVDELGRRTTSQHYGEVFGRYPGLGHHTVWGYNDRSEVTGEQTWAGQTLTDTSSPLGGRNYGYAYDPIGNRTTTTLDGSTTSTYTANGLNQYGSRTVAGAVPISGLAPASETVTVKAGGVDQGTVARTSNYFYKSVTASNSSAPAWLSLDVSTTSGGTVNRTAFVPAATESYTYDDDGNLTGDSRWTYTWDAENRLTSMETKSAAYGAGAPRQFLSFKYDHLGRRIRKTVANWNGSAYVAAVDRKFIYDGWNLIAECDVLSTFTTVRTYAWGLDISRTLEDAGGVKGLLQIRDTATTQTYQTVYDGNGNLLGLVQRGNGAIVAQYEYSPYGELLRSSGAYAKENPFRFSTKFTDDESGLVYYGRRYYLPGTGRWIGRDPKEERGGLNLYGFVANNTVNLWDYLGMNPPAQAATPGYQWELERVDASGNEIWTEIGMYGTPEVGQRGISITVMAPNQVPIGASSATPFPLTGSSSASSYRWITSGSNISGNSFSGPETGDSQARDALRGFLVGTQDANRIFGPDDPWTRDMQNHPHVQNIKTQLTSILGTNPLSLTVGAPVTANYNIDGQSLGTQFATLFTDIAAGLGLTGSQYSIGSFRLTYTFTGISDGAATFSFQANDSFSFGSVARVPTTQINILSLLTATDPNSGLAPLVAYPAPPSNSFNDIMGPNAPFNTVQLQWNWTVSIPIPPASGVGPGP